MGTLSGIAHWLICRTAAALLWIANAAQHLVDTFLEFATRPYA